MAKAAEIMENVYHVGVKDWNVRDFHGYTTSRGSTYNAYLIIDEKKVLIDTVKNRFSKRLLENIAEVIDPAEIDYVVSNHTEPDHSGSMPAVMQAMPNATVVATKQGESGLTRYYGGGWNFMVVKTGDSLEIGKRRLDFIATPMLHWPDSMATYLPADKLLFSMDGFGQHYAASEYFDDQVPFDVLMHEAKKYYANIIMHLGKVVAKTLDALAGTPIGMIAPSHGVIWRRHIPEIVAAYRDWSECRPAPKVLIVYDTMWMSTELLAKAIYEGAARPGVDVRLLKLSVNDLTDITAEALDAGALAVGSPTLNSGMMPSVSAFLTYIKGLKPANKIGAAFGSHGWAGGGAAAVDEELAAAGVERIRNPLTCVYRPDEFEIEECLKLGRKLAARVEAHKS